MTRPPRPVPVTAAAVLLMIVGYQLAFVAMFGWAGTVILTVILILDGAVWVAGATAMTFLCVIAALLAFQFLIVANRSLYGTLEAPLAAGVRIASLGFVLTGLSLVASCGCSTSILRSMMFAKFNGLTPGGTTLLGLMLSVNMNAVLVLIAGMLLHRNAGRYTRWQASFHLPSSEDPFEGE